MMLTRFFTFLACLLFASVAGAQSWHDDSRYVSLGPRTGYYLVRPGSHLSRQLGLEGAPISDTADPFVMATVPMRWPFSLIAPADCCEPLHTSYRRNRTTSILPVWASLSAVKARPQKYNPSLVVSAKWNNAAMASLVTTRSKFTILLRITVVDAEASKKVRGLRCGG